MKKFHSLSVLLFFVLLFMASSAFAVPTRITVRVRSKGAKFIGTSMGGVLVTIRNADTGELLAKGITAGSTGDTRKIMMQPRTSSSVISDSRSAKFTATIDIDDPVRIKVTATGPLAQRQAANTVSLTQWVVPGKNITAGDALLMEIPGFVVDVLAPPSHSFFKNSPIEVPIRANITMMCGCPVKPKGLWDANAYEVGALIKRNGVAYGKQRLQYVGKVSQFQTKLKITKPGVYEVTVYAYDQANGNTGLDSTTFMVR